MFVKKPEADSLKIGPRYLAWFS